MKLNALKLIWHKYIYLEIMFFYDIAGSDGRGIYFRLRRVGIIQNSSSLLISNNRFDLPSNAMAK